MSEGIETRTHEQPAGMAPPATPGGNEPDAPTIVVVGLVFAIGLFVVIVLLQAYFNREDRLETQRKVVAVAPEELSQLRAQQEELLNSYRWVDERRAIVAIPIDRAMELTVSELNAQPEPPTPRARAEGVAAAAGKRATRR